MLAWMSRGLLGFRHVRLCMSQGRHHLAGRRCGEVLMLNQIAIKCQCGEVHIWNHECPQVTAWYETEKYSIKEDDDNDS